MSGYKLSELNIPTYKTQIFTTKAPMIKTYQICMQNSITINSRMLTYDLKSDAGFTGICMEGLACLAVYFIGVALYPGENSMERETINLTIIFVPVLGFIQRLRFKSLVALILMVSIWIFS